jgi:hypothetical protein
MGLAVAHLEERLFEVCFSIWAGENKQNLAYKELDGGVFQTVGIGFG